jgi:nucleoside-diphosphate-sugar epimerase
MKIKYRNERVGDVSYECDINKAEIGLLFEPSYDLERGLELTLKWFRENWRNEK